MSVSGRAGVEGHYSMTRTLSESGYPIRTLLFGCGYDVQRSEPALLADVDHLENKGRVILNRS